ncbi:hypothetical protein [Krasilnikovia sp. M28-CT-15]|uniref:hypothetical protein n=1 Tax=Krasilnikovia sp. M28-CT-15 TaxID=3373540 RepID=UPI00399CA150
MVEITQCQLMLPGRYGVVKCEVSALEIVIHFARNEMEAVPVAAVTVSILPAG